MALNKLSLVDVVVPCYKYGHFLEYCINSVLNQSMDNLRIIIINDASPDDTKEVSQRLAQSDDRVTFITHEHNIGHISTYNEGIDWAQAPYLIILSADDMLAPGALERATGLMEARKDVVLAYGACIDLRGDEPAPCPAGLPEEPHWQVRSGAEFIRESCGAVRNLVRTPAAVVRTAVQKRVGGYRADLPHAGDLEMWLRLSAQGAVATTPCVQAFYRIHGRNMHAIYQKAMVEEYVQLRAAFDTFFERHGETWPEARRLQCLANKRLAEQSFWTGVAQFCRGNIEASRLLLRFYNQAHPQRTFLPPISYLLTMDHPGEKIRAVLSDILRVKRARSRADSEAE